MWLFDRRLCAAVAKANSRRTAAEGGAEQESHPDAARHKQD